MLIPASRTNVDINNCILLARSPWQFPLNMASTADFIFLYLGEETVGKSGGRGGEGGKRGQSQNRGFRMHTSNSCSLISVVFCQMEAEVLNPWRHSVALGSLICWLKILPVAWDWS